MGEEFVVHLERHRLQAIGRDDLALRVEWVAQTIGDGLGFDILSFNGAAVIQPRKRHLLAGRNTPTLSASMGPRSFNRGNGTYGLVPLDATGVASMGPRSFNRGNCLTNKSQESRHALQWGRGHSTAETRILIVKSKLLLGRFNGAAVIQPRKQGTVEMPPTQTAASMGPRGDRRAIGTHFGGRIGAENGPTVENFACYRIGGVWSCFSGGEDAHGGRLCTDSLGLSRWHEPQGN